MKATKMIELLAHQISLFGDKDVKVNLLTENCSNIVLISDIDVTPCEGHNIEIECNIGDIKAFRKGLS